MIINWNDYKNFSKKEFKCSHTGKCEMRPEFLDILQQIRTAYGKPIHITSGYRDPEHPIEKRKLSPGTHTYGVSADILCYGQDAMDLFVVAYGHGIRRIGLYQKGPRESRFIHLDIGDQLLFFPKAIWTY